jgi:hypothetical protein
LQRKSIGTRQAKVFERVEWVWKVLLKKGRGGSPYTVFPATGKTYDYLQR